MSSRTFGCDCLFSVFTALEKPDAVPEGTGFDDRRGRILAEGQYHFAGRSVRSCDRRQ